MKSNSAHWETALSLIKNKLDDRVFDAWIGNRLSFERMDRAAGILFLGVLSDIQKGQILLKYAGVIESAASEAFGMPLEIRFLLPDEAPPEEKSYRGDHVSDNEIIFNPRHTFENFIVGDTCRYAVSAAKAVAEKPGEYYSPLFIYGETGLGKTHLMNAIGIYILQNHPGLNVLFVTSETFTEDFVNASIKKNMDEMNVFKEKYRGVDVLLIDDIQFISEKEKTKEEVFNTYNALYNSRKQMVFTADRPPREILGFDERLKGRLSEGLLVDIKPPTYETRVAILKNKSILDGVPVTEGMSEAISFIAENIKTNVRELEGAFNSVVEYGKFVNAPVTKALARQRLEDVVQLSNKGTSIKDIKKVVASYFNISLSDLDSEDRSRSLSTPRQIAMYLSREMTDVSFPKIADAFKKDYSTIQHGYKKIKKEIGINDHLKKIVEELTEKIREAY